MSRHEAARYHQSVICSACAIWRTPQPGNPAGLGLVLEIANRNKEPDAYLIGGLAKGGGFRANSLGVNMIRRVPVSFPRLRQIAAEALKEADTP